MPTPAQLLAIYSNQAQLNNYVIDQVGIVSIYTYAYGATIYDGVVDASTALKTAISVMSNGGIIAFPVTVNGSIYLMLDDVTIPENIGLFVPTGARIRMGTGKTLTVNGYIFADRHLIFDGDGSVAGDVKNANVYPAWFGTGTEALIKVLALIDLSGANESINIDNGKTYTNELKLLGESIGGASLNVGTNDIISITNNTKTEKAVLNFAGMILENPEVVPAQDGAIKFESGTLQYYYGGSWNILESPSVISHDDLLDIGVYTHPEIDDFINEFDYYLMKIYYGLERLA